MLSKSEIKLIRSLHDKNGRREHGLFICEGGKLVGEIISSRFKIHSVYSTAASLPYSGMHCFRVSPSEMERISALKTPTEILAVVEIPRWEEPQPERLSLVLDGVQDPGNLGTIIRISDWFGIGNIYCSPDCADCFNPKVVQATMGAITRVKLHYRDIPSLLENSPLPVYGTFLDGQNIYDSALSTEGFIVMGSEGQGISDKVAAKISKRLLIPPFPADSNESESLNVAVATALVCSEFRRPERV